MKRRINVFLLMLIFLSPFFKTVTLASVPSIQQLETVPRSEGKRDSFIESVDFKLLHDQLPERKITCFDVSANGFIAVAFDSASNHIVQIYDPSGCYLYGYEFNCSGIYGIEFIGANLGVYYVRSNVLGIYSPNGDCIELLDIPRTDDNKQITYELPRRTQKEVNGNLYTLERDIDFGDRSYSRLAMVDPQGNKVILIDASAQHVISFWLGVLLFGIFCFVGVLIFVKKHKTKGGSLS